jgi:hypothetical protein
MYFDHYAEVRTRAIMKTFTKDAVTYKNDAGKVDPPVNACWPDPGGATGWCRMPLLMGQRLRLGVCS